MKKIIAIGALGGSGTRAVAQILIKSGLYMGDYLNKPNDNLIFSRLFKNPDWYQNADEREVNDRLMIFSEYMSGIQLSRESIRKIFDASRDNPFFPYNIFYKLRILKKRSGKLTKRKEWGWKEPNTQIFLEEIYQYFPNLKYIHVLRNGLDMAFSKNKQQLLNWGYIFGIKISGSESEDELAVKQLEYWIRSTKDVLKKKDVGSREFYLLNHSDFCNKPRDGVDKLVDFAGMQIDDNCKKRLYDIPRIPPTMNRYRNYDLKIFSAEQIAFVEEMGFSL